MIRNYLIVAWRNLVRHKIYSLINIAGLAIGMAGAILLFLLVRYEWTYDAFHEKADRIFRVYAEVKQPDGTWIETAMGSLLPPLEDQFPEVIHTLRLQQGAAAVNYHNSLFVGVVSFVEPEFFSVFSFPFLYGDPETALQSPNSVVINSEAARRYFGDENPLGKPLSLYRIVNLIVLTFILLRDHGVIPLRQHGIKKDRHLFFERFAYFPSGLIDPIEDVHGHR